MRLLGRRSELVVKHLHRVGHVQARLPNGRLLRLWSRGDDWIANQVFWHGWNGYEPETVDVFFRLAMRARVIVDVGAFVGLYSLLASHANPRARVLSFEPLPTVFRRLERNLRLNSANNVTCFNVAVGARSERAQLYHMDAEVPLSSSLSHGFMEHVPELQQSTVEVVALDDVVREHRLEQVDLVKIDTESTEPEVLRGMSQVLEHHRPDIVCEVLQGRGSEHAVQALLERFGYRFYLLTPDGPKLRHAVSGHGTWLNYLFTLRSPETLQQFVESTSTDSAMATKR